MNKESKRLYFAYGSNMDPEQMEERCPGAKSKGCGKLSGYGFVMNHRGVATLKKDRDKDVFGVLWEISPADERTLDLKEGVHLNGYYHKEMLEIETGPGEVHKALVYIDSRTETGEPRAGYLDKVLKGAEHIELPRAYLGELSSWTRA
ncbi:gamma-glutamylcyclotransferase family protein [Candidatus Riflebacteria bacterium]